jgi:predicted tellurium resistance membrane protein TerC
MIDWLTSPQTWIALITLTSLEIVLGVDNVIFISILAGKLPPSRRRNARRLGLFLAMFMRIGLLLSLAWLIRLTTPLFSAAGHAFDPDCRRVVPAREEHLRDP